MIRTNALVKFNMDTATADIYETYYKSTFEKKMFIFLGEVPNAPGHCILADLDYGKVIGMYHTFNFREATEEEI